MVVLRRFLVVQALMLWQGGFLFYAAFVVPTGTDVLGSSLNQGWITRRVTNDMNLVGAVALALLALDQFAEPALRRRRWVFWAILAATLAALVWLHPRMDALLNFEELSVRDHPTFRFYHRTYLWVCTVQWLAGLGYVWVTLRAWGRTNRADP